MPTVTITRKHFPRRGLGLDLPSELALETAYLPSFPSSLWQNISTGTLSPAQLQYLTDQAALNNVQAATDPTTGEVNETLLAQSNANLASLVAQGANVSSQSTGSVLADLADTAQGTGPGLLASLGINPSSTGGLPTINWSSILQTLLIFGAIGLGGYFLIKAV
jgi:hypothetical protein